MRNVHRPLSLLAAALLVPAGLALPVAALPSGGPHPVAPTVTSLALTGPAGAARVWRTGSQAARLATPAMDRTAPELLSRPLSAPHGSFGLVGLTWTGGPSDDPADIQVRVRTGQRWSGWEEVGVADDGPDDGTQDAAGQGSLRGTAPVLTGPADAVQVRVRTVTGAEPPGLTVHLVDPGSSPADADPAAVPAGSAVAATPAPAIITRRQWGADESLVRGTPAASSRVKALFLHHTDGSNDYSPAAAAAQVRAVLAFHTKVRGWNDIGYNFLVDRFGRIYEGRAGSIDAPMLGAHTGGFNRDSLGIATMGNFEVARPPAAMVGAVQRLMAWEAARYEIDPRGSTTLTSAGGGTSRYPAGRTVRLRTLSGHRDVGATDCPGQYLYSRLPAIRAAVAAAMRPGLGPVPTVYREITRQGGAPMTFAARIPTRQRWRMTVTGLCGGTVRTLTGRSIGRITVPWDLTDDAGQPVPAGVYRLRLDTWSPVGHAPLFQRDVEVVGTLGGARSSCLAQRVAIGGPADSSIEVARRVAPSATEVVVASADARYVDDALVAAVLARSRGAALLLVGKAGLPTAVATEVQAISPTRAWVVGRTSALDPAVAARLGALGVPTVTRVGRSDDPYLLAADAARVIGAGNRAVLVPYGAGSAEAGVGASLAAALGRPLLFHDRSRGMPGPTVRAMLDLGVTRVELVAADRSLPAVVDRQLQANGITAVRSTGPGSQPAALAAARRYGAALAPSGLAVASSSPRRVRDAVLAAAAGRLLLLTGPELPADSRTLLTGWRPAGVWVTSTTSVLPPAVLRAVRDAVAG